MAADWIMQPMPVPRFQMQGFYFRSFVGYAEPDIKEDSTHLFNLHHFLNCSVPHDSVLGPPFFFIFFYYFSLCTVAD